MEEPFVSLFGPIDAVLSPYIAYVLLVLMVVNLAARAMEYRQHLSEVDDGAENLSRHPLRVGTNALLVVGAFYYMTVHHHAGMVFSVLFMGVFLADLFEFESRKVEARNDTGLDRPKGALAASMLAFAYILYQTLFFLVAPIWETVI